jgi:hypothetical protein
LTLHAVLPAGHDNVARQLIADEEKIPIVARATTKHRLLVASDAERHVELWAKPFLTRESTDRDFAPALEGCPLLWRR